MLLLWWLFLAYAAYGSLYPFDFCASPGCLAASRLQHFIPFEQQRGDILANVALFLPSGALSVWAACRRSTTPAEAGAWTGALLLAALAWAAALQLAQVFLPSRVASLGDVFWNGVGLLAGFVFALRMPVPPWLDPEAWIRGLDRRTALLWCVAAAWPIARLAPFVPTADGSAVRWTLYRVVLRPDLSVPGLGLAAAGFLASLLAAEAAGLPRRLCLLIVPATLGAQVMMKERSIETWDVAGGVVALLLWVLLSRRLLPGRGTLLSRLPATAEERR